MWYSCEGLVSGGKTTFIEKVVPLIFADRTHVIIKEPVSFWQESGILRKSYENPATWAFPAQCAFFTSRIAEFRDNYSGEPYVFSERSPFSDKFFFAIQDIDPELHSIYFRLWDCWQDLLPIRKPTFFIYLRASVEICMERVKIRGRKEEESMKAEYQQRLYEEHEKHLMDPLGVQMPDGSRVPVIVVDATQDYKNNPEIAQKIAEEIRGKIYGTIRTPADIGGSL